MGERLDRKGDQAWELQRSTEEVKDVGIRDHTCTRIVLILENQGVEVDPNLYWRIYKMGKVMRRKSDSSNQHFLMGPASLRPRPPAFYYAKTLYADYSPRTVAAYDSKCALIATHCCPWIEC